MFLNKPRGVRCLGCGKTVTVMSRTKSEARKVFLQEHKGSLHYIFTRWYHSYWVSICKYGIDYGYDDMCGPIKESTKTCFEGI